ncbi:3-deoxy-D-manno-octulosonate 8-phosphate phosphatase (KDO 8-P phosphatase) [Candidatus Electrothrix aarhusensis]|uniref:3-deoxy-D-manno-octulosonate 8-phosphate phosphatase KdsC n=1 Tax=Candidatus Electrothrix aarhusensis TaxID=1859131 RepID=A0A444IQB4_9BACT|nr:3-deoxy-D-manno-octulosonate 8-phosphate phosphatase (KDO 8-P phosphatase) [Candidatus Electrothrix aarhusensis]
MDKVSDNNNTYSDCELTQSLRERAMKREQPILRSNAWRTAMMRAKKAEVLLLDVDGVLTDGTLFYSGASEEIKGFNTLDGFGLRLLRDAGIAVGLITARSSEAVSRRAKELKLEHVYTDCRNKKEAYAAVLEQHGWKPEQTAYMGDDWLDLPVLMQVGCSFAPANAAAEIRRQVDYVTERSGGHGAVREACELILEAKGLLSQLLHEYMQTT